MLPGVEVKPDTIILELSNPELDQELRDPEYQLRAQEAELAELKVTVESQLLNRRAATASVTSEYNQAKLQAEADTRLHAENLDVFDFALDAGEVAAIDVLRSRGLRICDFEFSPEWDRA